MQFKSYHQFINEKEENERSIKFSSFYNFTLDWWAIWQEKFKDKYVIKQNAINKIFTIFDKKTDEAIFIFDYQKETVYTNKTVSFFKLPDDENLTASELDKKVKEVKDDLIPDSKENDVAEDKPTLNNKTTKEEE